MIEDVLDRAAAALALLADMRPLVKPDRTSDEQARWTGLAKEVNERCKAILAYGDALKPLQPALEVETVAILAIKRALDVDSMESFFPNTFCGDENGKRLMLEYARMVLFFRGYLRAVELQLQGRFA